METKQPLNLKSSGLQLVAGSKQALIVITNYDIMSAKLVAICPPRVQRSGTFAEVVLAE